MELVQKFLAQTEFNSYDDFMKGFHVNVPDGFDFARDVVDAWATAEPEKLALIYCDDEGRERRYTFTDISALSKRAAAYFASIGIGAGDRVLTLLRRRAEYWICAVALHRLGAVVVPASVQLLNHDIEYRIKMCSAAAVLAIDDPFVLAQLEGIRQSCPTVREMCVIADSPASYDGMRDFNAEYPCCSPFDGYSGLDNDAPFVAYFTSGTAGYPKMVLHNRTYPLAHIVTAKYMQRVLNNGLHLTQADSGWAKFGWGNIYGQWICGTAVLAYDPKRFDSHRLMAVMEKYQPTSLCVPPTMYRFLLRDGLEKRHIASIHWFSTAGEPLSGEVNSQFHDICGHYIHEGYGQSEGTPITCSFEWCEIRPSSMGRPSPLYDVAIIDRDKNRCVPGENGEVVIFVHEKHQLGLLTAYGTDGDMADPVSDGIYHTGDIAYEDEDGYYWYVGRNDDMIKSSGYRIGPFEIESILNTHPAVKESAIVGRPDPIRGQAICAVIVLRDGFVASEALSRELQEHVKHGTAPYKYPRVVEYVPALPKNTSGKIVRSALR